MMQFGEMFKALTGYEPLSWQRRLYNEWFAGDIKPVIDLPTGMGKTSLMATREVFRGGGLPAAAAPLKKETPSLRMASARRCDLRGG